MARVPFVIAREVQKALRLNGPVVSLESSVIAQGLPFPKNIEAALRCERAIREEGAIPATIAVLDGQIVVGTESAQLENLAGAGESAIKVASRDLSAALVSNATGGTTVSATMEISAKVGIRVFSTGGVGGVHRGEDWDVSQDIWALGRFPVAVVCAGAKAILDLPRTMEALETSSVPVVGVGTSWLPGFYCQNSGLPLDFQVGGAGDGAKWMHARFDELSQGGIVFAVPPPDETTVPLEIIEKGLRRLLAIARKKKIRGKAVTPFLLSGMAKLTKGRSLTANLSLLENNARFAAKLSIEYSRLKKARSARHR